MFRGEMIMNLNLSEKEARCLESALARRVNEMMNELVHTTDRAAHAELKASYEEIDALHRRVKETVAAR
jgi:polyhydroxyalkanoate synthesis regulator phasin